MSEAEGSAALRKQLAQAVEEIVTLKQRIIRLEIDRDGWRKGELKLLLKRAPFGLALNDYVAGDGPAADRRLW